jgi:hypothetical protein
MKIAISLPDDLFASTDNLARRLGLTALAEFVAKHRASRVTERLDAVYASADNRLDAATARAQSKALRATDW